MTATEFNSEVDRIVKLSIDNSGIKPCCSKGCSTCCSEALMVDESEADNILAHYPADKMDVLKVKSSEWLEKFKPFQHAETRDGVINGYPYLAADIKCPFLDGNLCSVYEHRPMSCRTYFATGNPEHCKMPMRKNQLIAEQNWGSLEWIQLFAKDCASKERFYMDHLGVLLANKLLGANMTTSVTKIWEVQD